LFVFGLIFTCIYASNVENDLNTIALTQGYGYKTANLTLLSDLCKNLKNNDYTFDVPQFFGISSIDIQIFVKNILKKDLAQEWDNLIKKYTIQDNEWLTKSIASKKFPDGFLADAKAIEISINKNFDDFIKNNTQELKELFQDIKEISIPENLKTEKLMVRSTGKEDTDKLANAGGNESVANVDPETNQILTAMKIVIASYFSEKSLTQRLGAGDTSIPEAPFTPVLIQRMIGEKDDTNLPRCGVMFTEETEGALSKNKKTDDNGKIITSGITIIQCAYGHNEGVVNSIVPVDTYIVDSEDKQHAVIRPKSFRIAPKEALKLDRKDNDPAYINRPVLEPHAIAAMKQLATELETFYKKPMDVEFVIFKEKDKETIYIVQARPIVHNPDQPAPSYLDFNNTIIREMTSVRSSAIGSGGGELKFITNNNQIVIKKTINAALSEYQERNNKNKIKAVLIEENAPVTSHEATAFRSELKPVICIPDNFSDVEQWVKDSAAKILIDTQQQRIVQWNGEESFDLETFKSNNNNFAKDGWINYPMAQRISVYKNVSNKQFVNVAKNLNVLLLPLSEQKKQIKITEDFLRKQINIVKTGKIDDVKKAIAYITLPLTRLLILEKTEKSTDFARIKKLFSYFSRICTQILRNSDIEQDNDNYMSKRLFPIYILETLLFQNHKDHEGLYGDSIWSMFSEAAKRKEGAKNLTGKEDLTKIFGILGTSALTPELRTKWEIFISALEENGLSWKEIEKKSKRLEEIETNFANASILKKAFYKKNMREITEEFSKPENKQKIDFFKSLKILGNVNLLELWLHTCFADSDGKNIDDLLKEVADSKDFLIILADYKQKVETFSTDGFSDPKKFIKVWDDFKKNIFAYFVSDEFTNGFEKTNRLGKLAATNVMEMIVTKFDTAIKAVTGSNLYVVTNLPEQKSFDDVKGDKELFKQQINNNRDKIFTFHLMLEDYLKLLQKWLYLSNLDYGYIVNYWANNFITTFLAKKTNEKEQLLAEGFDSTSVVIGGSINWDRQKGAINTHEKFFIWTHQSLFAIIAKLMSNYGLNKREFPKHIQEINEKISTLEISIRDEQDMPRSVTPSRIGLLLSNNQLVLTYNLPQRYHSGRIKLIYNTKTGICFITFSLVGAGWGNRWELCSDFSTIKGVSFDIPTSTSHTTDGFSTTWTIEKGKHLEITAKIIEIIRILCTAADFYRNVMATLLPALKIDIKNIRTYAKFDRIYPGIEAAIELAIKSTKPDDYEEVLLILQKMLDPESNYAIDSEKALAYSMTIGKTLNDIINNTLNQIIKKLDIAQKEPISLKEKDLWEKFTKILINNQEYTAETINRFAYIMIKYFSENDKRAFATQVLYSVKCPSEFIKKIEPYRNIELATFVINRGANIFRIPHNLKMFSDSMENMNNNDKIAFLSILSKALDHRDPEIRKNAFTLLENIIQNPTSYDIVSQTKLLDECSKIIARAIISQNKDTHNLTMKLLDHMVKNLNKYDKSLSTKIFTFNTDAIIKIRTQQLQTATEFNVLSSERDAAINFISPYIPDGILKEKSQKIIESEFSKKNLEITRKQVGDTHSEITTALLNGLEKIYQDFSDDKNIIKNVNIDLIKNCIFDPKDEGYKIEDNMKHKFNRTKKLQYNDIKRFIKLIANAIKKENYSEKINDLFKKVFDNEYTKNETYWILGYLIWLNTDDYKNMLPVEISVPRMYDWQAARCIHILNEFIDQNKDKEIPSISIKKDVFEEYVMQALDTKKLQEIISTNPEIFNIREFAERSSEAIIITNKFEDLINLLQKPEKENNTIRLGSTVDLLRYLIVLHTKLFDKIPAAYIPIQVQKDKDTSNYIECLKNFKKTYPTIKITFENPFDNGIKNIFNDKELEEFAIEHTNTNEDDLEDAKEFMNDFALKAARFIRSNHKFDELKNKLPKSSESKEKVYLSECTDLLRYLILLNTRKFEEIPAAIIAKQIEPSIATKNFLRLLIRVFLSNENLDSLVTIAK